MDSWMYASQQDMSQDQLEGDVTSGTGTRRSYDCSFCKRGFTNAQALGGHMNIHRKDRAKKSKNNGQSSTSPHLLAYDSGTSEHYPYQYPSSVPVSEPLNYSSSAAAAGFDGYGVCWSSTSGMPAQPCGMMGDVSSGMNLVVGSRAAEVYDGYEVQKGYDDVDLELRL